LTSRTPSSSNGRHGASSCACRSNLLLRLLLMQLGSNARLPSFLLLLLQLQATLLLLSRCQLPALQQQGC
jgi:hypothetical protein